MMSKMLKDRDLRKRKQIQAYSNIEVGYWNHDVAPWLWFPTIIPRTLVTMNWKHADYSSSRLIIQCKKLNKQTKFYNQQ